MPTFKQEDYDRIVADLSERFRHQPDSRCASPDEVEMALLITGIDEHREQIEILKSAVAGIAPWLSASLSDPMVAPCKKYKDACDKIFRADQQVSGRLYGIYISKRRT